MLTFEVRSYSLANVNVTPLTCSVSLCWSLFWRSNIESVWRWFLFVWNLELERFRYWSSFESHSFGFFINRLRLFMSSGHVSRQFSRRNSSTLRSVHSTHTDLRKKNSLESEMQRRSSPLYWDQLSLNVSCPIWRGYLSDVDSRWNVLSATTDDRTREEKESNLLSTSRYSTVQTYLQQSNQSFNYLPFHFDEHVYQQLIQNGLSLIFLLASMLYTSTLNQD